jgi:hypothetical protein
MTKAIRIEHPKTGKGVYTSYGEKNYDLRNILQFKFCRDDVRHPAPSRDSLLVANMQKQGFDIVEWAFPEKFVFGFSTKEQCRAWFFSDVVLQLIHECGFKLMEIESENVVMGNTQVCIASDQITQKTLFDILEYFGIPKSPIEFITECKFEELLKSNPPPQISSCDLCVDLALEEYEQSLKRTGVLQLSQFFPYQLSQLSRNNFILKSIPNISDD